MVKIVSVACEKQVIPLTTPFRIALGTVTEAESIFLRIVTDQGIEGIGEAAPETLVTGETLTGCMAAIELMTASLIGENPLHLAKIHEIMDRCMVGNGAAKAAIDIACHDILGKVTGLPLYQLLGGYRDQVETDMTIGIDTPEAMAKQAKKYAAMGFNSLKIKVGIDPSEDIARVAAIQKMVGKQIGLRVDANQGWSAKDARKVIQALESYHIEFIEQPVSAKDLKGLSEVQAHTTQKIMADESVFLPQDAYAVLQKGCADAVNIKLMKCGGLYKALKINSICESAGIPCMIGCMSGETNVSITAAAHFAAAQPNIKFADLDAAFSLEKMPYSGIVTTTPTPCIDLSQSDPGLGIS